MTVQLQSPVTREESEAKRVPANIETAAFTPAVNATWEDYDLVAAVNTALVAGGKDAIDVTKAVRLYGVMEFINAGAGAGHTATFNDGDAPDGDDTENVFALAGGPGSEYLSVALIATATDGFIKIEVDDRTQVTMIFHLTMYRYIQAAAE